MNNLIPNSVINAMARQSLKGRWLKAAAVLFCICVIDLFISPLLALIFSGTLHPMSKGIYALIQNFIAAFLIIWWFKMVKYDDNTINHFQETLKKFGSLAGAGILYSIIVTIGYILFIIPGIIFQFAFGLVFFILADEPAMPVVE